MTQKEKIERMREDITTNSEVIRGLRYQFEHLRYEWAVYEDKYKNYLAKRDRFQNFLWRLYCKITFRSTKLTKKELAKRVAKKMARIFYEGSHK